MKTSPIILEVLTKNMPKITPNCQDPVLFYTITNGSARDTLLTQSSGSFCCRSDRLSVSDPRNICHACHCDVYGWVFSSKIYPVSLSGTML